MFLPPYTLLGAMENWLLDDLFLYSSTSWFCKRPCCSVISFCLSAIISRFSIFGFKFSYAPGDFGEWIFSVSIEVVFIFAATKAYASVSTFWPWGLIYIGIWFKFGTRLGYSSRTAPLSPIELPLTVPLPASSSYFVSMLPFTRSPVITASLMLSFLYRLGSKISPGSCSLSSSNDESSYLWDPFDPSVYNRVFVIG